MAIQLGTRPISSYVDSRARKMLREGARVDDIECGSMVYTDEAGQVGRALIYKYRVSSGSRSGLMHTICYISPEGTVREDKLVCTCEASQFGNWCPHAVLVLDDVGERRLPRQGGRDA